MHKHSAEISEDSFMQMHKVKTKAKEEEKPHQHFSEANFSPKGRVYTDISSPRKNTANLISSNVVNMTVNPNMDRK